MTGQEHNLTSHNTAANVADDREAHPRFLGATYTRPCGEKNIAIELTRLGIETFMPVQIRISSQYFKESIEKT